jgi:hypothetical protein
MNSDEKRLMRELIRRWRAVSDAHAQYNAVEATRVYANAKRDAYSACALQLETSFGLK